MAMKKKEQKDDKSKKSPKGDFFSIIIYRDGKEVFLEYYKNYDLAEKAFDLLHTTVKNRLSIIINTWTMQIFNAWKNKKKSFEDVKPFIETTWVDHDRLHKLSDKLYEGDVWRHFNECLKYNFLRPSNEMYDDYGVGVKKFYAYSPAFNRSKRCEYLFYLCSHEFPKGIDGPRKWLQKAGIATKQ